MLMKRKGNIGYFQVFEFRQDLGSIVPFASPYALLQLEVTCFPIVEDVKLIFSNLMSVQATFPLQLKLTATSAFDVPYMSV